MLAANKALSFGAVSILHAVASGSRFGFDVMEATGLTSGTVYPTLDRLEHQGLLRSRWEDEASAHAEGRPARRYFHHGRRRDAQTALRKSHARPE